MSLKPYLCHSILNQIRLGYSSAHFQQCYILNPMTAVTSSQNLFAANLWREESVQILSHHNAYNYVPPVSQPMPSPSKRNLLNGCSRSPCSRAGCPGKVQMIEEILELSGRRLIVARTYPRSHKALNPNPQLHSPAGPGAMGGPDGPKTGR